MTQELIERLRDKSYCKSWQMSDDLTDEAADALERLNAANAVLAEEIADYTKENVVLTATLDGAKLFEQSHKHALTVIDRLESERNAYQVAADKQAMAHKIERDGLGMKIDALAKYQLPDALYPNSKDWLASDYAARVEWLHTGYESKKQEIQSLLQQAEMAHQAGRDAMREECAAFVVRNAGVVPVASWEQMIKEMK